MSIDCSRPFTLGFGSKDQLTKQLSEKSFSPADWRLPTVASFLSYRPEIIQSTRFELQIREEEDDPMGGQAVYSKGQGQKEPQEQYRWGEAEAGVWEMKRGILEKTDATVQFRVHLILYGL